MSRNVFRARPTTDGAGVRIRRIGGSDVVADLDPFLMIDEIRGDEAADYRAGFPAHPHRGFETITYMLEGRLRHRDHLGNEGVIGIGGVQWMTAGRGIVHSEMPEQTEGRMHGFQIWLNLPARHKMMAPAYRDLAATDLTVQDLDERGVVRLIAGTLGVDGRHAEGPVQRGITEPMIADVELAPGADVAIEPGPSRQVLLYVFDGELNGAGDGTLIVLGDGEPPRLSSAHGGRGMLLAGRPLGEPVVQHGPFVMNTRAEIERALADYRDGRLTEDGPAPGSS